MGSHAITYAVVALAIAVVCLIAGFLWGRSDVKAKVEQVVEKEHVALDMREFTMRQQLDEAIAEIARLRPSAEELARVQKRLEREQAKYQQMKAEFNAITGASETVEEETDQPLQTAAPSVSADEAIQKLMQSLEALNASDGAAPPPVNEPAPTEPIVASAPQAQPVARPPAIVEPPKPVEVPRPAPPARPSPPIPAPAQTKPAPAVSVEPQKPVQNVPARAVPVPVSVPPVTVAPAVVSQAKPSPPVAPKSGQQQVDEWQEFARQLEALTGKKK